MYTQTISSKIRVFHLHDDFIKACYRQETGLHFALESSQHVTVERLAYDLFAHATAERHQISLSSNRV